MRSVVHLCCIVGSHVMRRRCCSEMKWNGLGSSRLEVVFFGRPRCEAPLAFGVSTAIVVRFCRDLLSPRQFRPEPSKKYPRLHGIHPSALSTFATRVTSTRVPGFPSFSRGKTRLIGALVRVVCPVSRSFFWSRSVSLSDSLSGSCPLKFMCIPLSTFYTSSFHFFV